MKVTTIQPQDMARWEAYVDACPRTVAWQSYHWSEAVGRIYRVEFHPLAAEEDGRIVGVLPLYRLVGPKAPARLFSVPFAVAGGMSTDSPEAQQALMNEAVALAGRLGAAGITFKQYRYPIGGSLKTDRNYHNRELDLTLGAGAIWERLDLANRQAIERADRGELALEYPSTDVTAYYDLLLRFMTRSGMPCPSREWIQTLLDLKMYAIALLRREGRLAAATMVKSFKTTVSFPFTCLRDRTAASFDAACSLYWRLIQRFAQDGHEIFHSGRMPESEDVESYRRGWGGEKHPYYYQYYPNTEGRTEFKNKRGWKRRVFVACWKQMPRPLAARIGPKIVARFP